MYLEIWTLSTQLSHPPIRSLKNDSVGHYFMEEDSNEQE